MLQAYPGSAYNAELLTATERLSGRLPERAWIDLQQIADEKIVFRAGAETYIDPEIWSQLVEACLTSKQVRM